MRALTKEGPGYAATVADLDKRTFNSAAEKREIDRAKTGSQKPSNRSRGGPTNVGESGSGSISVTLADFDFADFDSVDPYFRPF